MGWYDTGTISVTNGSTAVTGSGTQFISGAQVGEAMLIDNVLYEIQSIVSATSITLADNYLGSSQSGLSYKIIPTQSLVADLSASVTSLISDYSTIANNAGAGKFNDGTVTSPGIQFLQDSDNGLFRVGSNNWGLVAGGAKIVDVSSTGIDITGDLKLGDNGKATFGASDDLQIYHDGSNGIINNAGSGSLIIQDTDGTGDIYIRPKSGQTAIAAYNDNTVEIAHSGNVKLSTTSTGIDVAGTATMDGLTVNSGTANVVATFTSTDAYSLIKFEDNDTTTETTLGALDNNMVFRVGGSERMRIDSSGNVGIGTSSPTAKLAVSGTANGAAIDWTNTTASTGRRYRWVSITSGGFALEDLTAGTERMRIDSTGNLLVGTTSVQGAGGVTLSGAGYVYASRPSSTAIYADRTGSAGTIADFRSNGITVGTISVTASTTTYNTSSDYRLKDITGPLQGSGDYIDSLNPVEGTWKADGSIFVGLLAHEADEVSRTKIATGEKDGEEMQGMDYSSSEMIANLIKEVQSLRNRVAQLEG